MSSELNLRFPDEAHVLVSLDDAESGRLPFSSSFTAADRRDLPWYLEVYGAHSLGDPEAARIAARLPELGKALFDAVFHGPALRLFQRFQDQQDGTRLLTVSAEHPEVLALPEELLHNLAPAGGYFSEPPDRSQATRRAASMRVVTVAKEILQPAGAGDLYRRSLVQGPQERTRWHERENDPQKSPWCRTSRKTASIPP
jgi:hypothetical protein